MNTTEDRVLLGTVCEEGSFVDTGLQLFVSEEMLHTHTAIFGGTRQGKSKLYEQLCRELFRLRRGFCFLDPHSDTADDLLAFLAHHQKELGPIRKRNIHYLNPDEMLFAFDPFFYEPHPSDPRSYDESAYFEWLHVKALDVQKIITRVIGETEADQEKQVRLNRWMQVVLIAVGIRHNNKGDHFGLEEALILLSPTHFRYAEVIDRVLPLLDNDYTRDVHADLLMISGVKDAYRREQWVESTINRLRRILSPIMRRIFQPRAERINFRQIIASNGIIIASLGKRERFGSTDGQIIAGLIIREIGDAIVAADRDQRQRYYMFIDEAHRFMGEDLDRLFKEAGKYKLSLSLAVQSLNNLVRGDLDLTETVLGMCDVRITFRQQHFPVAEMLARDLCHPLIDFTPLIHEVQRNDGTEFIATRSTSRTDSVGGGSGLSLGTSHSDANSVSQSEANSRTQQKSASRTLTEGTTSGSGGTSTRGLTDGTGESASHRPAPPGEGLGVPSDITTRGESANRSLHESDGNSWSSSQTESKSIAESKSKSLSKSLTKTEGVTVSDGTSRTESTSDSWTQGASVTLSQSPIAKFRLIEQATGQLVKGLDIQDREHTRLIQQLPKQHCLVCLGQLNTASIVRVADVHDPYEARGVTADWKAGIVEGLKTFIYSNHLYYFDREADADADADTDSIAVNRESREDDGQSPDKPNPFSL